MNLNLLSILLFVLLAGIQLSMIRNSRDHSFETKWKTERNNRMKTMQKNSRIYVAGHKDMIGSAILRALQGSGFENLVLRSPAETDLRDKQAVQNLFEEERPEYVFLAATRVGGIMADQNCPADFMYDNLAITTNIIHTAWKYKVKKLLFVGSNGVDLGSPQRLKKNGSSRTGSVDKAKVPLAIAQLAGIRLCEAYREQYGSRFISVVPPNLYGIGDNYHLRYSYVIPGLIRRFHEAIINRQSGVTVWGSGTPRRQFLFADDFADACLHLVQTYEGREPVMVSTGIELTILELAQLIRKVTGYSGHIMFDPSKPDGAARKLADLSRMQVLDWKPKKDLRAGISAVYADFLIRYMEVQPRIPENEPEWY